MVHKDTLRIVIRACIFTTVLMVFLLLSACAETPNPLEQVDVIQTAAPMHAQAAVQQEPQSGQIYLYVEKRAQQALLAKEAQLWYGYYHNEGMRHLFIEMPYYTTQLSC